LEKIAKARAELEEKVAAVSEQMDNMAGTTKLAA